MRMGLGLSIARGLGKASGGLAPLYAVSAFNSLASLTGTLSNAAKPEATYKVAHAIGGADVSRIVMSWSNWALGADNTDGRFIPADIYRVREAWLTTESGASAQLKMGGATSWDVAPGTNDMQCDPLLPSDFGLSVFARNTRFALGVRWTIVTAGGAEKTGTVARLANPGIFSSVPCAIAPSGEIPTSQLKGYNGLYGSANWAVGGGALPCVMLGSFVGSVPPVYIGMGDSITESGPGAFQKPGSYFARAMMNDFTTPTQYRAGLNLGRSGGDASNWALAAPNSANAIYGQWCKYANVMIERHGVNKRNYPTQFDAKRVIWSTFAANQRTAKFKRIAVALTGQTTSTDAWATLANQTLGVATGPGLALAQMNDSALADVGTNLDYYLETLGVRGNPDKLQNDYWRWAAGPTTDDGLHPNATGHESIAASLRSLLTTIEAGW